MNNVISIETRRPVGYADKCQSMPPAAATLHSKIKPGSRLTTANGCDGWIVFRTCYEGETLTGYEVSKNGRRSFLRAEAVTGVMS